MLGGWRLRDRAAYLSCLCTRGFERGGGGTSPKGGPVQYIDFLAESRSFSRGLFRLPRARRGTADGGCAGAAGGGAAGVEARRAGGQWRCRSCSSASSSVRVRFPFRAVLLSMSLVGNICMSSLCMLLSAAAVALLRLQRAALGAFGSGATRGGGSAECLVRRAACVCC